MKKIFTFCCFLVTLLFTQLSLAQTNEAQPVAPGDTEVGGGGGTRGSLVYLPFNSNAYSSPDIVGECALYENNGPSFSSNSFWRYGHTATGSYAINFMSAYPGAITFSSPVDNKAKSATFSGSLVGRVFRFYDSPNGFTDHDWTEVYFRKDPPANYSYYLWGFECSFGDEYVIVTYHTSPYHGIDGSVSRYETNR